MEQYLELVETVLSQGSYKPNRTGVDTLSSFNQEMTFDLSSGFPLLTTKKMGNKRWDSLIYEFLWYLSGEIHVRELQEHTSMWNPWTDGQGYLDSSIGRFWRHFPIPEDQLGRETWPAAGDEWVTEDGRFDQIRYVIDRLKNEPYSRRLVVSAWHPANAAVSRLPPCEYTFVCNVQNQELNVHLTQRSGDIALGIPYDIARYALLAKILAQEVGLKQGTLAHTIVDAHIYCGSGERGKFYRSNIKKLQNRIKEASGDQDYQEIIEWIKKAAPEESEPYQDHVPGLLRQMSRNPKALPQVKVSRKDIDDLSRGDFELINYNSHPEIQFKIAE